MLSLPPCCRRGLQDLGMGLSSRPVWQPTASASLPRPRGSSWLPVPAALRELQGDSRRGAPPGPLGLPLSLLSMDDAPGSCTVFSPDAAAWGVASECDAASADSVQPQGSPSGKAGGSAAPRERQVALSCPLWSLEEAELAQHALLALQSVAASLAHLQALLAAPEALPRRSIAGLLQRLAAAGELRQHLQRFVAAFSAGGSSSSVGQPTLSSSAGGSGRDPVQQAFATAVAEVLLRQSAALQQLEQQEASDWLQTVVVGGAQGRRFAARSPSLLQVALHTGRLQLQLRTLASLCWCIPAHSPPESPSAAAAADGSGTREEQPAGGSGGSGATCPWQEGGFPSGTTLLDYLYRSASEAGLRLLPPWRLLALPCTAPVGAVSGIPSRHSRSPNPISPKY